MCKQIEISHCPSGYIRRSRALMQNHVSDVLGSDRMYMPRSFIGDVRMLKRSHASQYPLYNCRAVQTDFGIAWISTNSILRAAKYGGIVGHTITGEWELRLTGGGALLTYKLPPPLMWVQLDTQRRKDFLDSLLHI